MNRINLVCLGVRDMEISLAFYRGIGFKTQVTEQNPPIVFFNNSGTKLELFPLENLAKDINETHPPRLADDGFNGITFAINVKSKHEVDDLMELVQSQGGTQVKPPQTVHWGGYSGYFRDPDGYYWEIAWASFWKFDDRDMLIIDESP